MIKNHTLPVIAVVSVVCVALSAAYYARATCISARNLIIARQYNVTLECPDSDFVYVMIIGRFYIEYDDCYSLDNHQTPFLPSPNLIYSNVLMVCSLPLHHIYVPCSQK